VNSSRHSAARITDLINSAPSCLAHFWFVLSTTAQTVPVRDSGVSGVMQLLKM
jgi:hypothetical protein